MILGFTGTRQGMTPAQREALPAVYAVPPTSRLLIGGAVGADEELIEWVASNRRVALPAVVIEIYPASVGGSWLLLERDDLIHPLMPPLQRNRIIAQRCDRLIACPAEAEEQLRSGTWATVRYARGAGKPITIIAPDGTVREES